MSGSASTLPDQAADEEPDKVQVVTHAWEDVPVLHKLQQGILPPALSAIERDRVGHQIARFGWKNGLLFRVWLDGTRHIVPRPDQRAFFGTASTQGPWTFWCATDSFHVAQPLLVDRHVSAGAMYVSPCEVDN